MHLIQNEADGLNLKKDIKSLLSLVGSLLSPSLQLSLPKRTVDNDQICCGKCFKYNITIEFLFKVGFALMACAMSAPSGSVAPAPAKEISETASPLTAKMGWKVGNKN